MSIFLKELKETSFYYGENMLVLMARPYAGMKGDLCHQHVELMYVFFLSSHQDRAWDMAL